MHREPTVNVDWFRFWLQDYEDPDPTKAEQYACWHELRKMQQQNETTSKETSSAVSTEEEQLLSGKCSPGTLVPLEAFEKHSAEIQPCCSSR